MIPEKITIHCSHGDARPLEQLQKLIPEPHYSRIVGAMDSQSLSCLLEYIARYGEWLGGLSQQQGPRWVKGTERIPDSDHYDEPSKYLVRTKGDDHHSGWIWGGYMTREGMQTEIFEDYWEWLDESPSPVTSTQEEKESVFPGSGSTHNPDNPEPDRGLNEAEDSPFDIQAWLQPYVEKMPTITEGNAFVSGAMTMYHKMQEEMNQVIENAYAFSRLSVDQANEIVAKDKQIATLQQQIAAPKVDREKEMSLLEQACDEIREAMHFIGGPCTTYTILNATRNKINLFLQSQNK